MPCNPDWCDDHDFMVAPNSGWCRMEFAKRGNEGGRVAVEMGLSEAINRMGDLVRKYLDLAGIKKPGSCHLFRHTMATLMLENGCDVRYLQAMLGHSSLSTTEIYTQVSIRKLRDIHTATHPAKPK